MRNLRAGGAYSRKDIWTKLRPGETFPTGGNWLTGYATEGSNLFIFANIGVPGKTGHDFPNQYDAATGKMVWYGKPNAHSAFLDTESISLYILNTSPSSRSKDSTQY